MIELNGALDDVAAAINSVTGATVAPKVDTAPLIDALGLINRIKAGMAEIGTLSVGAANRLQGRRCREPPQPRPTLRLRARNRGRRLAMPLFAFPRLRRVGIRTDSRGAAGKISKPPTLSLFPCCQPN